MGDCAVFLSILIIRQARPTWIQVVLNEWPYRVIWIPRKAIEGGSALRAGERDILLRVWGGWAREWEQAEHRRWMERGVGNET